jgi:hypothetical protein
VGWALGLRPGLGPHALGAGGGCVDLATGSTSQASAIGGAGLEVLAQGEEAEAAASRLRWAQLHAGLMCGAWVGVLPLGLLVAEHRWVGGPCMRVPAPPGPMGQRCKASDLPPCDRYLCSAPQRCPPRPAAGAEAAAATAPKAVACGHLLPRLAVRLRACMRARVTCLMAWL